MREPEKQNMMFSADATQMSECTHHPDGAQQASRITEQAFHTQGGAGVTGQDSPIMSTRQKSDLELLWQKELCRLSSCLTQGPYRVCGFTILELPIQNPSSYHHCGVQIILVLQVISFSKDSTTKRLAIIFSIGLKY